MKSRGIPRHDDYSVVRASIINLDVINSLDVINRGRCHNNCNIKNVRRTTRKNYHSAGGCQRNGYSNNSNWNEDSFSRHSSPHIIFVFSVFHVSCRKVPFERSLLIAAEISKVRGRANVPSNCPVASVSSPSRSKSPLS